ncbi:MAG: hypothetical protein HQL38_13070, partial [Alphaproteobacteria bacterium]|nr:hypothetical protein [Alphaproteobacteria bacterium]
MTHLAADFLGLPGLVLEGCAETDTGFVLTAVAEGCPEAADGQACPGCRVHDYREFRVHDVPHRARPTELVVRLRRRRCVRD